MGIIKKAGIVTGIAFGGILGGSISLIGKMAKNDFLDELGESVTSSAILTGSIVGEAVSGAVNATVGKAARKPKRLAKGKKELKRAGGKVWNNFTANLDVIADNSVDIIEGVRQRDGRKIKNGAKTLGKVAAISFITVGAVKLEGSKERTQPEQKTADRSDHPEQQ